MLIETEDQEKSRGAEISKAANTAGAKKKVKVGCAQRSNNRTLLDFVKTSRIFNVVIVDSSFCRTQFHGIAY